MNDELRNAIIDLIKVIDKAISMEHNAHIYYSMWSQKSPSAEGRKMFQWLANFEANHEDNLRRKREELLNHPALKGILPPTMDDEYKVSEAGQSVGLPPDPSETDVLKLAILNESKAYAFYQRKLTHAADDGLKIMFETFAKEEEKHIRILSEMRQRLLTDGLWGDIDAFEADLTRE